MLTRKKEEKKRRANMRFQLKKEMHIHKHTLKYIKINKQTNI